MRGQLSLSELESTFSNHSNKASISREIRVKLADENRENAVVNMMIPLTGIMIRHFTVNEPSHKHDGNRGLHDDNQGFYDDNQRNCDGNPSQLR